MLGAWSKERRKGVDDSSALTAANGNFLLGKSSLFVFVVRLVSDLLDWTPSVRDRILRWQMSDSHGYSGVNDGFFLPGSDGGGAKSAQVYMKTGKGDLKLSDRFFWETRASLTLLLLRRPTYEEALSIQQALDDASLAPSLLAEDIFEYSDTAESSSTIKSVLPTRKIFPVTAADATKAGVSPHRQYDSAAFRKRFNKSTLCALLRPDFVIFSQAQSPSQLARQLKVAVTKLAKN